MTTRVSILGVYACVLCGIVVGLIRVALLGVFLWLSTVSSHTQERITLTTPVQVSPGATLFRVWVLDFRRGHPDRPAGILAIYREVDGAGAFISGGRSFECRYEGSAADTLLVALNKANLSTTSLERRVMTQCQADKQIGAGTISGVVQ